MYPTMTMSLLRHNSNYGEYSQGKQRLKWCVLTYLLIYLNLDQTIVGCPKMLNMITL